MPHISLSPRHTHACLVHLMLVRHPKLTSLSLSLSLSLSRPRGPRDTVVCVVPYGVPCGTF